jgi:serine/threonine-protein kinase
MAGSSVDDPMIGQTIAEKYVLGRRIGAGGMGVVYEAEHAVTHRRVAVKLMSGAEQQWTPVAVQRFLREARVAAMIGHPNIIEVLDAGTLASGLPYIVLTLLQGESLATLLHRAGVLPPRDAVEIAIEVLEALNAAHARNVVHRDIKPENVFVSTTANGRRAITLLDFGISKVTAEGGVESKTLTKTGSVLGTADYMSPEQVRGDDEIDGRTDLWAVGVMLYRMVSGQLPFAGKNYNLVVVSVLTEKEAPLAEVAPKVPHALGAVIARAMAKDRSARFASASQMLEALRALIAGVDANDGAWTQPAVEAAEAGRASLDSMADLAQAATVVTGGGAAVNPAAPKIDTLAAQTAPTRDGVARGSAGRRNLAIGVVALAAACGVAAFSLKSGRRVARTGVDGSAAHPTVAVVSDAASVPLHALSASGPVATASSVGVSTDAGAGAGARPDASAAAVAPTTNAMAARGARLRSSARVQPAASASAASAAREHGSPAANGEAGAPANAGQATRVRTGFDEL